MEPYTNRSHQRCWFRENPIVRSIMSKSRYNWEPHIQRMHDLYMEWMPIPDIWKEIQAEGFTPSLRTVYYKFKSMNYPTDQHHRGIFIQKHMCRSWPTDLTTSSTSINPEVLAVRNAIPTTRSFGNLSAGPAESCYENFNRRMPLHENDPVDQGSFGTDAGRTQYHCGPQAVSQFSSTVDTQSFQGQWWLTSSEDIVNQDQYDDQVEFGAIDQIMDQTASDHLNSPQIPHVVRQMGSGVDRSSAEAEAQLQPNASPSLPYSHEETTSMLFHERFGPLASSIQTGDTIYSVTPPLGHGSRHFDGKSIVGQKSLPPFENHFAPSVNDSGYGGSGLSTVSDSSERELEFHPKSLTEFGGLHRTPCCHLHEPRLYERSRQQLPEHFKGISACERCLYSGLHDLGWSARQLPLEVFQAEIKNVKFELEREGSSDTDTPHDLISLDAAGNSSLHYAAAGGSRFEHFKSLIEHGVSPYQLNSAGQLFLHCWQPHIADSTQGPDDHLVSLYYEDLESLLNLLQWQFFRWRDNDGKTVLDSLACVIKDERIQQRTFQLFRSTLSQVFSRSMSSSPQNYPSPRYKNTSPGCFEATSPLSLDTDWNEDFSSSPESQGRGWSILGHATTEPSYVDPETGDNVWHALARLALPRNFLLSSIQDYLWKDVDLNLPNNNGEYPLITFIRSRPKPEDDETDAQRSKYLETLMWKDSRPYIRIPSQINVNIRDRSGASALYHAVIRGQSDSVRSLIERGANVNARLAGDQPTSILQATMNARDAALLENDPVKMDRFKNIIDYLRDEKAVMDPTIEQERQWRHKSLMRLPM